jgi:hypothetical protein
MSIVIGIDTELEDICEQIVLILGKDAEESAYIYSELSSQYVAGFGLSACSSGRGEKVF